LQLVLVSSSLGLHGARRENGYTEVSAPRRQIFEQLAQMSSLLHFFLSSLLVKKKLLHKKEREQVSNLRWLIVNSAYLRCLIDQCV